MSVTPRKVNAPTKTVTCTDCGSDFTASIYSRSKRCIDCQKTHERLADNASKRIKRAPHLLPTEYPCEECGQTINWQDRRGRRPKRCTDCRANWTTIYERKYREPRPPLDPETRRRYALKHRYGMTPDEYDRMHRRQKGLCAGCHRSEEEVGVLYVDHDHACCPRERSCGACLRGLLCRACNTALGLFDEDPERLNAARTYLRKWQRRRAT